jgi:hypothetical protein
MRYNLMGKWLYGRHDSELSNNDLLSAIDIDLQASLPHFYYWGLFNFLSSYSLRVNSQLQVGLGVAYNAIDRKNITLNLSEGLIYEYSNIILEDSTEEHYNTMRNSFRVKLKFQAGMYLNFGATVFYQPSLEYAGDHIIRSETRLGIKIRKWLSLTTGLTYNEISRNRTRNLLLSYGVILEHYF